MPQYLLAVLLYTIPIALLMIPFIFICRIITKQSPTTDTPTEDDLEKQLEQLIKNNTIEQRFNSLKQDLQTTPTHTIASYIRMSKNDLIGFHLFQLIFSLIKNDATDEKIIKILHHYLPSCSTAHIYALLKSCKAFLNISAANKKLQRDLNQNHLKSTLLYLEQKISQTLNQIPLAPAALQTDLTEKAATECLVFAAFSQFYNSIATEKILRLAYLLSAQTFITWHQLPKKQTAPRLKPWAKKLPLTRHHTHHI